mgnify:CR=1 FL=1
MSKYDFKLDVLDDNTIAWIAKAVKNNSRVLEFGPANGRLTKYLSEEKKCKVDIVEIDEESGHDAEQYAVNALIGSEKGNIENYYWEDLGVLYDFIIFADVLEHLVHPEEVVKHCRNVMNSEGRILVSVPNVSHNSIIIELMKDCFEYNPTGLLDNTHLKFFTRQSFERMVVNAGWTIVEERTKQIRVGETEIQNSYNDVSREVFKELIHREHGDVYQYFFSLALSEDYLLGNAERIVSLDSTSYYYLEAYFEFNGEMNYTHSVSRHFDPYYKSVDLMFSNLDYSKRIKVKPINCNCVLNNIVIYSVSEDGKETVVPTFSSNGQWIEGNLYFISSLPELEFDLPEKTESIHIQYNILDYDFKNEVVDELYARLNDEFDHVQRVCQDYETEMDRREEKNKEEKEKLKEELVQLQRELDAIKNMNLKKGKSVLPCIKAILNRFSRKPNMSIGNCNTVQINIPEENRKKISAVIPNYNYARYLVQRIDSIVYQTYPISELIILDDCSTDDSIAVINKYIAENKTNIPIRLVKNEKNSGSVFAQWQKAFDEAKGDYVWIAEADDSCNEHFLETVMKGFDDKNVILSYCESLTMDENNAVLMGDLRVWIDIFKTGKWDNDYIKDGRQEVSETMCINNTIANVSSAVIKNGDYRAILEKAKEFHLAGDWFTYMNILKMGKIAYFKESLNYHRMQQQGLTLSTSHKQEFEEIVRLQDYAMDNFDISDEVKNKVYERRERERIRFGL